MIWYGEGLQRKETYYIDLYFVCFPRVDLVASPWRVIFNVTVVTRAKTSGGLDESSPAALRDVLTPHNDKVCLVLGAPVMQMNKKVNVR